MVSGAESIKHRRADFYRRIGQARLAPLWSVLDDLVTAEPVNACSPYHWRYDDVRPFVLEAGDLIGAAEAVRRVLILENPGFLGQSRITPTLYAGLQLILPGELAPAHRHTQSALRFVIEGEGAYTTVNNNKTVMRPGDFVITPSWAWHDHGNDSDRPMIWLDGLDIPLAQLLGVSFAENGSEQSTPPQAPRLMADTLSPYGDGLLPLDARATDKTTPIFNYPYSRTRAALLAMASDAPHPAHGYKLKYSNPITGDFPIPTIGTFMQRLAKDFVGLDYQGTDASVFCVVEGEGRSVVGEHTFDWQRHDVFVVPSWVKVRHEAHSDAILFSFSDRPIQEHLGFWREKIGA